MLTGIPSSAPIFSRTAKQPRKIIVAMENFERYGKTFEYKFFDKKIINTMEGANFQQVLANNFHDYVKIFLVDVATLFGLGIFFHDGLCGNIREVNQANLLARRALGCRRLWSSLRKVPSEDSTRRKHYRFTGATKQIGKAPFYDTSQPTSGAGH